MHLVYKKLEMYLLTADYIIILSQSLTDSWVITQSISDLAMIKILIKINSLNFINKLRYQILTQYKQLNLVQAIKYI